MEIQVNEENMRQQSVSGHRGIQTGSEGDSSDALKNPQLLHELSEGIKGLMNCRLEARSLSDAACGAKQRVVVTRGLM